MTVVPYTSAELVRLLVDLSESTQADVCNKAQRKFLEVYLDTIGAKTIVVEEQYIDKDYLHDFSGYYVSCFHNYRRVTSRLHFFSASFQQVSFDALLTGAVTDLKVDALQAAYLGFIVIKPLPQTVIGRTCLKTYPGENGRRNFPVLQQYNANLAGIQFQVQSLAFQEQDSVAAACATSALWSCFHATGRHFQHPIPSPTEITNAAAVSFPDGDMPNTRTFPNKGLSPRQMAHAINSVGLEPQIIGAANAHLVKSTLYAYLQAKIPVLFGIDLHSYDPAAVAQSSIGRHAVAVTGYGLSNHAAPIPYGATGLRLYASRIEKLYVHDDQLGPFARMSFTEVPPAHFGLNGAAPLELMQTEWVGQAPGGAVLANPLLMLLPLYKKIRIPFDLVHDTILELDAVVETIRAQFFATVERPEWDIFLTTGTDFKSEVMSANDPGFGLDKLKVLNASLPRFVWRVTARAADVKCCELLFDATGLEQSSLLVYAKIYSTELQTILASLATVSTGGLQTRHLFKTLGKISNGDAVLFPA